eukprot:m.11220 g.11220  ORF g.11220 m.11220 type:complete len:959 (+) comp6837_c0_seq2:60-2936(+)
MLRRKMTKNWQDGAERNRLIADANRKANWGRWGPYLSERQWGTVREDYSPDGSAWDYFPHDHARSRVYRWGEDGLLGITDRQCRLCFGLALWNEEDPILKERLFGLTGSEGNHGEDVKELYYYLDATPTNSYLKGLYKYPQAEYPYEELVRVNKERGLHEMEYEVEDTGVFDENRYWDVTTEYAKYGPNDICIRVTVKNRGPDRKTLHVLPQLWLRNTWSWGEDLEAGSAKGSIKRTKDDVIQINQETLGEFEFYFEDSQSDNVKGPELMFTDNETNFDAVFGSESPNKYTKDAFHRFVVNGEKGAVNPECEGTKAAGRYVVELDGGESYVIRMRLVDPTDKHSFKGKFNPSKFSQECKDLFHRAAKEADDFYHSRLHSLSECHTLIERQALAGLLWSKQFYNYNVKTWMEGDKGQPQPPSERLDGRNRDWFHLYNRDIISMPDKWEYPWYATWDLAFHMVPMCVIDPDFAKNQLVLFLREWYMHPNGALPAYEWAFDDVNPPVHAWACWRVYKMTAPKESRDLKFLEKTFHKLMLNFTWWVNRKDPSGNHVFSGGFLGLDNIGLFDRSNPIEGVGDLVQADGTSWMAFFSVTMLDIALELASFNDVYEDIASKFFEHFVEISHAINCFDGSGLWDDEDNFYYDHLCREDGTSQVLRVRSMVGLIPLYAVLTLDDDLLQRLPNFKKRFDWFLKHTPDLPSQIQTVCKFDPNDKKRHCRHLLSIPSQSKLRAILQRLFDEEEFLSPYGIRSLSKVYDEHPYETKIGDQTVSVKYTPAESNTTMFGGNSNWRGPIWFPVNYLIIEALDRYHFFYGDDLKVEVPTGSGTMMTLKEAAGVICARLAKLFELNVEGRRPCNGPSPVYSGDEDKDLVLFYEYFHPETGRGVGASHQTGWTSLIARCLSRYAKQVEDEKAKEKKAHHHHHLGKKKKDVVEERAHPPKGENGTNKKGKGTKITITV